MQKVNIRGPMNQFENTFEIEMLSNGWIWEISECDFSNIGTNN